MRIASPDNGLPDFEQAYHAFIDLHSRQGPPGSRERVRDGLGTSEEAFLERVWWPAFRNFTALFPEYQVDDYFDGHRYIDFAYIRPKFRIAIEIEGFEPHWKNITTDQFTVQCHRGNHLVIDEWRVLRFSYQAVMERPRLCQQTVEHLIGRLTGHPPGEWGKKLRALRPVDRGIVQYAYQLHHPFEIDDVMKYLHISRSTAIRHLHGLIELGWLQPAVERQRVHKFRIHPQLTDLRI